MPEGVVSFMLALLSTAVEVATCADLDTKQPYDLTWQGTNTESNVNRCQHNVRGPDIFAYTVSKGLPRS